MLAAALQESLQVFFQRLVLELKCSGHQGVPQHLGQSIMMVFILILESRTRTWIVQTKAYLDEGQPQPWQQGFSPGWAS